MRFSLRSTSSAVWSRRFGYAAGRYPIRKSVIPDDLAPFLLRDRGSRAELILQSILQVASLPSSASHLHSRALPPHLRTAGALIAISENSVGCRMPLPRTPRLFPSTTSRSTREDYFPRSVSLSHRRFFVLEFVNAGGPLNNAFACLAVWGLGGGLRFCAIRRRGIQRCSRVRAPAVDPGWNAPP